jgi:alkyldihydroxyacetonephosphate synthase
MSLPDVAVEELAKRLPAVTFDDLQRYGSDAWPLRGEVPGLSQRTPRFAVKPQTPDELAQAVTALYAAGVPTTVYGGGSNVVGAIQITPGSAVIDTREMNSIGPLDRINGTIAVDAGANGGVLERRLNDEGFTLGHYPQSLHISTVGGWISTLASGSFSTGYGSIEDLVISIDVVLPNGTLISSPAVPRSATGPWIPGLFLGAEGAFGIVARAILRARQLPEERRFRTFAVDSIPDTLEALRTLLQTGVAPAAIRLYDERETESLSETLNFQPEGALLLLVFDGRRVCVEVDEELVAKTLRAVRARPLDSAIAERWHKNQYSYDWLIRGNDQGGSFPPMQPRTSGRIADAIEVVAGWRELLKMVERVLAAVDKHASSVFHHYSHFYPEGASAYVIFQIERDSTERAMEDYRAVWTAAMDVVLEEGGAISHHHGIGQVRRQWLDQQTPGATTLFGAIKTALDPKGLLNKGALGGS